MTYTPGGVRIAKRALRASPAYNHKYITDVVGKVPAILLVLDGDDGNAVVKTYIHVVCLFRSLNLPKNAKH